MTRRKKWLLVAGGGPEETPLGTQGLVLGEDRPVYFVGARGVRPVNESPLERAEFHPVPAALLVDGKITVGTWEKLRRSDQPWIHEFLHGPRARGAMTARESHGNG